MSNGRKLFRILTFIDEINKIEEIIHTWKGPDTVKRLELASSVFSFFYSILDTFVWAADIGIISKSIYSFNIKWKKTKDAMSLVRNLLQTTITLLTFNEDAM
jgi:hypothetical protein